MSDRNSDYITLVRSHVKMLWDSINALKSLQREWNALDYGKNMPDGDGTNKGLTKTEVGAAVFATVDAISDLLDTGHATSLAKLL